MPSATCAFDEDAVPETTELKEVERILVPFSSGVMFCSFSITRHPSRKKRAIYQVIRAPKVQTWSNNNTSSTTRLGWRDRLESGRRATQSPPFMHLFLHLSSNVDSHLVSHSAHISAFSLHYLPLSRSPPVTKLRLSVLYLYFKDLFCHYLRIFSVNLVSHSRLGR